MPPGVFLNGGNELRLAEIRPKRRRDDEFGVTDLPEQKIAHPHLAAGADENVGIGNVPRPEMLRDDLFVDVGGIELAAARFLGDLADIGPDCAKLGGHSKTFLTGSARFSSGHTYGAQKLRVGAAV